MINSVTSISNFYYPGNNSMFPRDKMPKYTDFSDFNADKGIEFYETLKNEDIELSTVLSMIKVKTDNRTIDDMTNKEILDVLKQRLSVENVF